MIVNADSALQSDGVGIRHGQSGRSLRERPEGKRPPGGKVADAAARGAALRGRHLPGCRGGRDQHLPRRRSRLAQRQPVRGRRHAAAGALGAELAAFVIGHLDDDVLPCGAELVGEDHRQRGLGSLSHLRIGRDDRDPAARGDAGVDRDDAPVGRAGLIRARAGTGSAMESRNPPPMAAPAVRNARRESDSGGTSAPASDMAHPSVDAAACRMAARMRR